MSKSRLISCMTALVALMLLIGGCSSESSLPTGGQGSDNPWANLPVVGTNGTGVVDQRGGIIKVSKDVELQVPKSALPDGESADFTVKEMRFSAPMKIQGQALQVTYSNIAWEISTNARRRIPIRLLISRDKLSKVLPALNDEKSITDAIEVWNQGTTGISSYHVIAKYFAANGAQIAALAEIGGAPSFMTTTLIAFMSASRQEVRNKCELEGGAFFDHNSVDWDFLSGGYICRPPAGKIWIRHKFTMSDMFGNKWPFVNSGGLKLITANVGNSAILLDASDLIDLSDFKNKLVSDVVAQRIANNLSAYSPDLILLQELHNGNKQLHMLLDLTKFAFKCSDYSNRSYECVAWKTAELSQVSSTQGTIVGKKVTGERPLSPEKSGDDFLTDYCLKDGGSKDSGGFWVLLRTKKGIQFKAMSVHTATTSVKNSAYCREEQLLTFLQELDIARCTNCGNAQTMKPKWRTINGTRVLLAGDFNIDPVRGGAGVHKTKTDMERFKWIVDWSKALGDATAPTSKNIDPLDLNAVVALRSNNALTTSYLFRSWNKSLDHVLATPGLVDQLNTRCAVLDGNGNYHALSEDWWNSNHSNQEGMDHYGVACSVVFNSPTTSDEIAYWSFDACSGQDESGNGYSLNGDFTGRCVTGVNGKNAATVVSVTPEIPCLHVPIIPELGTAQHLIFDFWFRFRNMSSWSNGKLAHHGTALFSFGQGDTQSKAYFGLFEYPEPDFSKAHIFLDFEDQAYGQGHSGVRNQTDDFIIADENYHHVVINVNRQAGTASLYIDENYVDEIQITSDFSSLGNEPGYLGGHAWWGGINSCSSASSGPRAIIDLDEFVIHY